MKRPRQHEIDDEAQAILRNLLPSSWVCSEFRKDYGKDFLVELVDKGELTGKAFVVQLKGIESPRTIRGGSMVSFPMEVDHLRYYADKMGLPVFLVVANVAVRMAYWIFVQEDVDTALSRRRSKWREQKNVSVHVPVANDLSDTAKLRAAVDAALDYMKGKYPGKVEDAIAAAKRKMEELDPRIGVEVGVRDGKITYTMHPKEDVEFSLRLSGDKDIVAKKYRELVDEGRLVDLSGVNARILGLPSVHDAGKVVQVQFQRRSPMEVRICLLGPDGSELSRLDPIAGHAVGGMKEMRLCEPLGQSILNAHLTWTLPHDGEPRHHVSGTFSFDMGRWGGKHVSVLPYFDQVNSLVQHLADGGDLRWIVTTQGNELFDQRGRLPVDDAIRQVAVYCSIFRTARGVAQWSGIDPVVPATMTPDETDDLFHLAEILDPQRRTVPHAGMELVMEMPREKVRSHLETGASPFGGRGVARVVPELPIFSFLGVPVEVYGFVGEISEVQFQQSGEDMRRWLDETEEPVARVSAISAPGATLTKEVGGVRRLHGSADAGPG